MKLCEDIGQGPVTEKTVWAVWPAGAKFPTGWWFEPLPFGDEKGWPYDAWPAGDISHFNASAAPSAEMIDAAAAEMKAEFENFFPSIVAFGTLPLGVLGLVAGTVVYYKEWSEETGRKSISVVGRQNEAADAG